MEGVKALLQTIDGTEIDLSEIGSLTIVDPFSGVECSNCLQKFVSDAELTKSFLYGIEDEAGIPDTFMEVTILDALNYILRWRSFGITFQQQNGRTLQFEEEGDTGLCKSCAGASAKLYSSIRSFDSLTQKESKISQMTSTFVDTIVELANANVGPDFHADLEKKNLGSPQPRSVIKATTTKFVPYKHDDEADPIETKYTAADVNVPAEFTELPVEVLMLDETQPGSSSKKKKTKTQNEVVCFACEHCGAKFNKRTNLTRHLLLTHNIGEGREKIYKCEECGRSFHFQYMLKSHVRIHSEDRSEQCPKCPMRFKGKDGLFHHVRDVHRAEEEKPRCSLCKTTFKQERSLQEHMLMIHRLGKGRKFVSCPKCAGQFKRKRSMLAHLRNGQCHSERVLKKLMKKETKPPRKSKPDGDGLPLKKLKKVCTISRREPNLDNYPCPFHCGKTFARKSSMMSHITHLCRLKPKDELDYEFEDEEECIIPKADVLILSNQCHRSSQKFSGRARKLLQDQQVTKFPLPLDISEGSLEDSFLEEGTGKSVQ